MVGFIDYLEDLEELVGVFVYEIGYVIFQYLFKGVISQFGILFFDVLIMGGIFDVFGVGLFLIVNVYI